MTLAEVIRDDLLSLISDDPVEFVFQSQTYTGTKGGLSRQKPLEIGGFEPAPDLVLVVNLYALDGSSTFASGNPSAGSYVTVGGVEYRVDRTEVDTFGECLQMDLRSKAK